MRATDIMRPCRGAFELHIFRNGVEIERYVDHNLIVNGARTAMAMLTGDPSAGTTGGKAVTRIGFGTNTNEPQMTDTALSDDYFVKYLDGYSYPDEPSYSVKFSFSLDTTEGNGLDITEFGLLCEDGTLFARKVRESIHKGTDLSLSGTWTIMY